MAAIVADSIAVHRQVDVKDLVCRYSHWWRSGAFDTGPTFALVFGNIACGLSHDASVLKAHEDLSEQSAGCAPAQRIASIAACHSIPDARLGQQARLEASITHFDPDAGSAAAIVTYLTRLLLRGYSIAEINSYMEWREPSGWANVKKAPLGSGGTGYEAVKTAWHCLLVDEVPMQLCERLSGVNNYAGPILGAFMAAQRWRAAA
jgi:ADP-ribosylglycohydrolase